MEIDGSLEWDPSNSQEIRRMVKERQDELLKSISKNILTVVSAYWPIETGLSRQSFKTVIRGSGLISLTNRIRYALYVNFRRVLNDGNNNPNFLIVQRLVRRYFSRIVRETSRGA